MILPTPKLLQPTVFVATISTFSSMSFPSDCKNMSFDGQKIRFCDKKYGPMNQWDKSKWINELERVEISAGLDDDGT